MIRLDATTKILQLVASATAGVIVTGSSKTATTYTGFSEETAATAATQTICAAPGADTVKDIDHISIKTTGGANTLTVQMFNSSGSVTTPAVYAVLGANETLEYTHASGWSVIDATGSKKFGVTVDSISGLGTGVGTFLATPSNTNFAAALTGALPSTAGGTGNAFTKFSGPTTSEKTKTLSDANATIIEGEAPAEIGSTTPGIVRGTNKEIFKTASADSPLTAAQCAGTIVSNYGMTDADCTIDLPTAAEGLAFVCILPAVRARFFKLHCPTAQADKIYLLGVAGSDDGNVGVASGYATGAACSFFTFKASDGGYDWFAIPLFGTWVAS